MHAEPQRRVVRGAFRGEVAPLTTEVAVQESVLGGVVAGLVKIFSDFATELLLVGALVGTWFVTARISVVVAWITTTSIVVVVLGLPWSRRFVFRLLRHARVRRQFENAARFAGLATANDHVPHPHKITDVPVGERLRLRIPSGSAFSYLEDATELLATCLNAREVRVEADPTCARFATATIIRRDPFGDNEPIEWPNSSAVRLSVWQPIPVGVDEYGQTITVTLPERNLLLGGEPGAGKSVALSQLVATAALDPDCKLTLLDGKQVELACWSRCAQHVVGPSIEEAIEVLRQLRVEMDQRYAQLLDAGKRKVEPDMDLPLHVVVCDELAFYLTMGDNKQNKDFANLMRDLVARGRAAGVIVLAATQKPSHDIIPTSLRDLFAFRWALRCTTPQASDTILGQGWSSEGFSAKEIDAGQRGVGYLLSEGGEPVRIKSFCLTDDDLDELASRGNELRKASRGLRVA